MANVMGKRFSPSLIDLPAMVVVNERTGSIIVTGDVEISAVTVGNDKLVITTTTPAPIPSSQDPLVARQNWAEFGTTGTNSGHIRIQDLLEAFKHQRSGKEQIQILSQIEPPDACTHASSAVGPFRSSRLILPTPEQHIDADDLHNPQYTFARRWGDLRPRSRAHPAPDCGRARAHGAEGGRERRAARPPFRGKLRLDDADPAAAQATPIEHQRRAPFAPTDGEKQFQG